MIDFRYKKRFVIIVFFVFVFVLSLMCLLTIDYKRKKETIEINSKRYALSNSVVTTETWIANEMSIDSLKEYNDPFNDIDIYMLLSNGNVSYKIPGFWDGKNNWKIRFVCTEEGEWSYHIACSDSENEKFNKIEGRINCDSYSGNEKIFKNGFIKTSNEKKYLSYNNDLPFFYLGDTHWSLGEETVDMVKEIAKKRKEQGFTVIQSEPIGEKYSIYDGISKEDLDGFKDLDEKFKIIANEGLVHANAEFFYTSYMENLILNFGGYNEDGTISENAKEFMRKATKYWVARYGCYPVIWTLGQECDNDFYATENNRPNWKSNNPYKLLAQFVNEFDPYNQLITAHQENYTNTRIGNSVFKNDSNHNLWAAQWLLPLNQNINYSIPKEYWENEKPSINYEGRYCYLMTKNFGARAQGWISYLNGFYGYGYGAQDTWSYKNKYIEDVDSTDGIDVVTSNEKKNATWKDSLEYPSSYQVGYMKDFFEKISNWEELIPRFDDESYFVRDEGSYASIASNKENNEIVIYFYNFSDKSVGEKPNAINTGKSTGELYQLKKNHEYRYVWFDPISGQFSDINIINSDSNGHLKIPEKKETDMVFYIYDNNPDFGKYIANEVGINYRITEAKFSNTIFSNEPIKLELKFTNEGTTQLYEPCSVYVGLLDENYQVIKKIKTNIDPHTCLPGKESIEQLNVELGNDSKEGDYLLSIGLFYDDSNSNPTYKLKNKGETEDNWYVLGNLKIQHANDEIVNNLLVENNKLYNKYKDTYAYSSVKQHYENLLSTISKLTTHEYEINQEFITNIYNQQIDLLELVMEYYRQKNNLGKDSIKIITSDYLNLTEKYEELFSYNVTNGYSENVSNVRNLLNDLISKYNANVNVDISNTTDLVEQCKQIYETLTNTDNSATNYLNKLRIIKTCEIASKIMDYDIELDYQNRKAEQNNQNDNNNVKETNNQNQQEATNETENQVGQEPAKETMRSGVYRIKDNVIKNLPKASTPSILLNNLGLSNSFVVNRGTAVVPNDYNIATGDILKFYNENYTLIIIGDVNQDGLVNLNDLIRFRKVLLGAELLNESETYAADVNQDNKVNIGDLIGIRNLLLSN